jgi:hypothetical protein
MQNIAIREAAPGDFESICALNLAEVQHTSPMDVARLQVLDQLSVTTSWAASRVRWSRF